MSDAVRRRRWRRHRRERTSTSPYARRGWAANHPCTSSRLPRGSPPARIRDRRTLGRPRCRVARAAAGKRGRAAPHSRERHRCPGTCLAAGLIKRAPHPYAVICGPAEPCPATITCPLRASEVHGAGRDAARRFFSPRRSPRAGEAAASARPHDPSRAAIAEQPAPVCGKRQLSRAAGRRRVTGRVRATTVRGPAPGAHAAARTSAPHPPRRHRTSQALPQPQSDRPGAGGSPAGRRPPRPRARTRRGAHSGAGGRLSLERPAVSPTYDERHRPHPLRLSWPPDYCKRARLLARSVPVEPKPSSPRLGLRPAPRTSTMSCASTPRSQLAIRSPAA